MKRSRGLNPKETRGEGRRKKGDAPESRIVCDDDKDILIDNVINYVLAIAEAVVWFNPLIVADLDTTGVVAGFGITITNLYSSGDPVRGDPEAAD